MKKITKILYWKEIMISSSIMIKIYFELQLQTKEIYIKARMLGIITNTKIHTEAVSREAGKGGKWVNGQNEREKETTDLSEL